MYKTVLGMIQRLVGSDLHNPWVFDFEASMVHAHREVMSESTAVGCFFHFTKAIDRKVASLGFRVKYTEDVEFRRRVLALSTLAFLPLGYVQRAFDALNMLFTEEERAIPEYFAWTYLGTERSSGSRHLGSVPRPPLFPPSYLECSWAATDGRAELQQTRANLTITTNKWDCTKHPIQVWSCF